MARNFRRDRRGRFSRRESRHLYTNPRERERNLEAFERRYGKARGPRVFGAVVGKVRREQVAAGTRAPRERVRAHLSTSARGRRFRVRGHFARVG